MGLTVRLTVAVGGAAVAVGDLIGEAVESVVIELGRVSERAVGVEGDFAVAGKACGVDGECVAVEVVVVVENPCKGVDG